jgi:hypothetical protein
MLIDVTTYMHIHVYICNMYIYTYVHIYIHKYTHLIIHTYIHIHEYLNIDNNFAIMRVVTIIKCIARDNVQIKTGRIIHIRTCVEGDNADAGLISRQSGSSSSKYDPSSSSELCR